MRVHSFYAESVPACKPRKLVAHHDRDTGDQAGKFEYSVSHAATSGVVYVHRLRK